MSTRDNNGRIILDRWTRDTITPEELDELSRADKVYLMTDGGECDCRDWCKCCRLADGRVYAINEGAVLSAQDADGNEIPVTRITDDDIHDGINQEQVPCYRCPWMDDCERCDDWIQQLGDEAEARAERKAAAAALGRIGGRIGGRSRSEAKVAASRKNIARVNEVLSAEERKERARIAAAARWAGAGTCTDAVRTLRERTEKGE